MVGPGGWEGPGLMWVGICLCQVGGKVLALVSRWVGFVYVKWVRRGWPWSLGGWGFVCVKWVGRCWPWSLGGWGLSMSSGWEGAGLGL